MCGFAGEFLFQPGRADLSLACAMAQRLRHRGPDEEGSFLSADGRCAIGLRRLAVIDPAGSHQPMSTAEGRVTVAFNGEIYNFRALRQELMGQGVQFRTAGDTEVLAQLYRRDGPDMLARLDGMFAFAIHDAPAGQLLLARDRLGEKPLWYAVLADRIVFASEAKALLAHPLVGRDISPCAIISYMSFGYVPAPESIWSGIRKLPPAHRLIAAETSGQPVRYWQVRPRRLDGRPADIIQAVRESLSSSVQSRMVSDVPLGALLSGGIDSSIVVSLMCRAAGKTGGIRTFTAGFEDAEFDERPWARRLAEHCRTEHMELTVPAASARQMLDRVVDTYDEPFGDSSAVPTCLICQAARQHVKVVLAGDGGDEVFGGYDRYRAIQAAAAMRPWQYLAVRVAAALLRPWVRHDERNRLRRFLRFAEVLPYQYAQQYFMYRRLFGPDDLARLMTEDFLAKVDVEQPARWFCELYEDADLDDEVGMAQRHDLMTYLPDDLLVKTDMASMASSLEVRAPMLRHDLVELGLWLPVGMKIAAGRGKAVLREAFADLVPADLLRRRKQGFAAPLDRWLRTELLETMKETLFESAFAARGIVRPEAMAGLINDHLSGKGDHRHRLWALLVLARWMSRHG